MSDRYTTEESLVTHQVSQESEKVRPCTQENDLCEDAIGDEHGAGRVILPLY